MKGSKTEIAPGVWRLRVFTGKYRSNGSPILVSRTIRAPEAKPGAGSRLADRELSKLVTEVSAGKISTTHATVSQLLDRWLEQCELMGHSPWTMKRYRQIGEAVLRPELGHLRLSKLTAQHLDRLYAKLTAKGNKPLTVRRIHTVIGAMLAQGERWDLVSQNVARKARPPAVHAEQIAAPNVDEVRAILSEAERMDPTLAALLGLAAVTGARRGELCALRWNDLDWDANTLSLARSIYETAGGGWGEKPTKTHQVRRISLDEFGLTVLRRHRAQVEQLAISLGLKVPRDTFMFSRSPQGSEPIRPDALTKFATRAAKAAGVDTHMHALRHFTATQAIGAGYDARTVASRLGHADPSITLRVYSHAIEQRDRELAIALGNALASPRRSGARTSKRARGPIEQRVATRPVQGSNDDQ